MKVSTLPQPVVLLKHVLIIFCMIDGQGRELDFYDCMKYTLNIGRHPDTNELICFKLGMMLNTTKVLSTIPV